VLKRLARVGFRRGVLGGSPAWTRVMVAAAGLRLAKRVMSKGEGKVVYCEELQPGKTLVISHAKLGE
jgi:hypothetical protein